MAQCYLGCPGGAFENLRRMNDKLNAEVMERVNDTQELVMLNNFARESNEFLYKKCLQERISEIASWQWVLQDLNKRLGDAIDALHYEDNALRVVVQRIDQELSHHCQQATRPGALKPMCDNVEQAIIEECNFLSEQRTNFEYLIAVLENQVALLDKTRKRIKKDILNKEEALSVEKECAKLTQESLFPDITLQTQKKKESPVDYWEDRCRSLKQEGLQALTDALVTRQQVRGARVQLSVTAQSYAGKVDGLLRRRLHTNKVKLQDLYWQKEEIERDYKALGEELSATEENLIETMEQQRLVKIRLADRRLRPNGELTKDDVDRKLRDELGRLSDFVKQLRSNRTRIMSLQNQLTACITQTDCLIEDLMVVIRLDKDRIQYRLGDEPSEPNSSSNGSVPCACSSEPRDSGSISNERRNSRDEPLQPIREEDEDDTDEYPFDY